MTVKWLLNNKLKRQIAAPQFGWGNGAILLVFAMANGGNDRNVEPGFAFARKVAPNINVIYRTTGEAVRLMTTGEASIAYVNSNAAASLAEKDPSIGYYYPADAPLFLDADFWINLPVYTDHPVLGVNGSLVNATLWNASNTSRFFRSPATAPEAVAEMSAIPELRQTWIFTIVSLERYQFIGGPYFNSLYTVSEPLVWLSTDPVILDSLMLERMNYWRKRTGFQPVSEDIQTLQFAEQLGVGSTKTKQAKIIPIGE